MSAVRNQKSPPAVPSVTEQLSVDAAQAVQAAPRKRHGRRFLIAVVTLFVIAGVAAILCLMMIWLPNMYRQQAARMIAPTIHAAQAGESVFLGTYEQDGDKNDGTEPIEWIVLDKEDDRSLLISRYALDCVRFNNAEAFVTWDESSILTWLNTDFYYGAFNGAERAMLLTSEQKTDTNPYFDTDPGEVTHERIFLLNIAQVAKYMPAEDSRRCKPTTYAIERGAITDDEMSGCIWWLRSPGFDASAATRVLMDGRINFCGYRVQSKRQAVRPAVWVTLNPDTLSD